MANKYSMSSSGNIYRALLLQMATTLIWKDQSRANYYEKDTDSYYVELFMGAKRGILNFAVIKTFDEEIINALGYTGEASYPMIVDKEKIPEADRAKAVKLFSDRFTQKDPLTMHYSFYVERNNYYRELTGLPPIEDTEADFVYITEYNTEYPMDIPVHLMTMSQRLSMERDGTLDKLIEQYPKKKYLRYLGQRGIDIFAARAAERFDLLYAEAGNETFEADFREMYNQNKYVINAVYYAPMAFSKRHNDFYENFLAMSILFMTIQQMHHKYLLADISRDFYDVESIRYIYDSYDVPFYSEIPLEYHTKIAKKMNKLINYKGSATVFFDLFDIFDSSSMQIYAYYITKNHRFENGKPIFPKNADGTLDTRKMYDVAFSRVKLGADPALETADPGNRVAFPDLTYSDPYWVNDEELFEKIYSSEFNYTESKYIGLQTVLDVLSTTYQNAYFFKMMQDNNEAMEKISIRWAATNAYVSLFDFFIYMAALYCKKYGYTGELTDDLAFTATVLGYDFRDHVENFKKYIAADPILSKDEELIGLINKMDCSSLTSVNTTFQSIKDLRNLLVSKFSDTHDKDEYRVYRDIYDTLLTSENMRKSFNKSTGEMATSYEDLLADTAPSLFQRLYETDLEDIDDEIRLVIRQVEEAIPSIRTLDSAFGLDVNALIDSLFKILTFFKSAKAELVGYNIVYIMSLRGVNFFKMMDLLVSWKDHVIMAPDKLNMTDIMEVMREYLDHFKDMIYLLTDEMVLDHSKWKYYDYINRLQDEIKFIFSIVEEVYVEDARMADFIISVSTEMTVASLIPFADKNFILHEEFLEPRYHGTIKDHFHFLTDMLEKIRLPGEIDARYNSLLDLQDFIERVSTRFDNRMFNAMNTTPIITKDELIMLTYNLLGSDDYLTFLVKEISQFLSVDRYESKYLITDRFIIRLIATLLPYDDMILVDLLMSIVFTSEHVDRIRLRDELCEGTAVYEELLWSVLPKLRDRILRIAEKTTDIDEDNSRIIMQTYLMNERAKSVRLLYEKFGYVDKIFEGLPQFTKESIESKFEFEDHISPADEDVITPNQIFYLEDFVPEGLTWSECIAFDKMRFIDKLQANNIVREMELLRSKIRFVDGKLSAHDGGIDLRAYDNHFREHVLDFDDYLAREIAKVDLLPSTMVMKDCLREKSTHVLD